MDIYRQPSDVVPKAPPRSRRRQFAWPAKTRPVNAVAAVRSVLAGALGVEGSASAGGLVLDDAQIASVIREIVFTELALGRKSSDIARRTGLPHRIVEALEQQRAVLVEDQKAGDLTGSGGDR